MKAQPLEGACSQAVLAKQDKMYIRENITSSLLDVRYGEFLSLEIEE